MAGVKFTLGADVTVPVLDEPYRDKPALFFRDAYYDKTSRFCRLFSGGCNRGLLRSFRVWSCCFLLSLGRGNHYISTGARSEICAAVIIIGYTAVIDAGITKWKAGDYGAYRRIVYNKIKTHKSVIVPPAAVISVAVIIARKTVGTKNS
jgi:hypothetical protein